MLCAPVWTRSRRTAHRAAGAEYCGRLDDISKWARPSGVAMTSAAAVPLEAGVRSRRRGACKADAACVVVGDLEGGQMTRSGRTAGKVFPQQPNSPHVHSDQLVYRCVQYDLDLSCTGSLVCAHPRRARALLMLCCSQRML